MNRLMWMALCAAGISGLAPLNSSAEGAPGIPALHWTPRSDWINVKDRGAVGDGKADDTVALQALLDTVKSGMVFYFPPGTYRITKMLTMTGPALGTALIGHGRDTILRWDGDEGGRLLREDGFAQNARYEGFVFDGQGKADIGFWHVSNTRFETEELHRNMAFIGFRKTGIHMELNYRNEGDKYATAEIVFQNCLFENCGVGVWAGSFNDYNYTYEGCEFRGCGIGVHCFKGNFYIRNTHFEGSRNVDVEEAGEHGCSLRRVTSWGSRSFLMHAGSVTPVVVQDCHVGGWKSVDKKGPAAITLRGGPTLLFDSTFEASPDGLPPVDPGAPVVTARCRVSDGGAVFGQWRGAHPAELALAKRGLDCVLPLPDSGNDDSKLTPQTRFLKSEWPVPGQIFDARTDFGAKGDGVTDDTEAIQKAINAARQQGRAAMAYLPAGKYVISRTLNMEGSDYSVGGCGPFSRLVWRGEAGGTMLAVQNPQRLRLENIMIGHHDAGLGRNAIDILQTETIPSSMTYEAVFVFGMYQKKPFERGLQFRDLAKGSVVILDRVNGNLRFTDCARATVFAPVSYEGSLVVEGKKLERDGFMGFQTRLSTIVAGGLYVRDNHSLVMSDFYMEQSDSGYHLEGGEGMPSGRVTIQAPKLHLNEAIKTPPPVIEVRDYQGEILLGPIQFPCWPQASGIQQEGTRPVAITLMAGKYYEAFPDWRLGPSARLALLGNVGPGPYDRIMKKASEVRRVNPASSLKDTATEADRAVMAHALQDLRSLGELDLRLNYPTLSRGASRDATLN